MNRVLTAILVGGFVAVTGVLESSATLLSDCIESPTVSATALGSTIE